ncbi:MAG: sirohydrochlorin cobaltochelatase, partial [Desulfohalobiaceae bacterium]
MRKVVSICSILSLFLLLPSAALAHSHGHHKEEHKHKQGILLVAFGSSYPQAQDAFDNIEEQVEETFPETPVRWAYTSKMV